VRTPRAVFQLVLHDSTLDLIKLLGHGKSVPSCAIKAMVRTM
jgi:hypothetical protein